jgi:uncharacterized protein (TIGR02466 family)
MQIYPLFSTPLYQANLFESEFESFREQISLEKTVNNIQSEEQIPVKVRSGLLSSNNQLLNDRKYYKENKFILKNVENYIHNVLKVRRSLIPVMTQSWSVYHKKGDSSHSHIHSNSMFSGVFYLKCDEDSGRIFFTIPLSFPTYSTSTVSPHSDLEESNIYNSREWWVQPVPGDILIFPSHLEHYVETSNSDEDRYCIAFNYFLNGDIASDTFTSKVTIHT